MISDPRRAVWIGLVAALAVPVAAGSQGTVPRTASIAEIVERSINAVVLIRTYDANGKAVGLGSGFIGRDGRVVTNAHVLEGASSAEIIGSDGQLLLSVRHAEGLSSRVDIAVLTKVPFPRATLPLASRLPVVGEAIVVIGAPGGLSNTVSDGIVSAIRREEGRTLLQVSAPISHGSSGGPVLNLQGEVVGVSVGSIADGQNLNFAIPAADVQAIAMSPPARVAFPALAEEDAGLPREKATRASEPVDASRPNVLPDDPAALRNAIFQLPVRAEQHVRNILVRFLGCHILPSHSEVVCLVRLANTAGSGQTRVFIDRSSFNDRAGLGGRLAEIVFIITGESVARLPFSRNISAGSEEIIGFGFVGVPLNATGGSFRTRVSPGWSSDFFPVAFDGAVVPAL